jgi:hypothetical protein
MDNIVALGTQEIDPADAAQAYIDGLCEKIDKALLAEHEAMVIAEGRIKTIIMENVQELALMAGDETQSDVSRINCGLLAQTYANFAAGMTRDIEKLMLASRLVR